MNIGETGMRGEALTAAYLRQRGFTVIRKNYQCRYGEIDIIAENREYIVFTEVKTRRFGSMVCPAEAVDAAKRRRILLTARDFLSKYETELQPRFDVAEVLLEPEETGGGVRLHYIKNAFGDGL